MRNIHLPEKQLIELADFYDNLIVEAKEQVFARNLAAAQRVAQAIDDEWQQKVPEAGSYEGNALDETNITVDPTPKQILTYIKAESDNYIKGIKAFKDVNNVLPAIDNHIHKNMEFVSINRDGKGYVDCEKTIRQFMANGKLHRGIAYLYTHNTRSTFIKSQTTGAARHYCTMVPLILAVFKRFGYGKLNSIPYSMWDRKTINKVVAPVLAEAMLEDVSYLNLTRDDLVELRNILFGKSTRSNPVSTYTIYGKSSTKLADVNPLVCHMLLQTWACNPTNRNQYMVLDPEQWDLMPEALPAMESEVVRPKSIYNDVSGGDIPW